MSASSAISAGATRCRSDGGAAPARISRYDSAGIAVAHAGELRLAKCKGRVRELEKLLPARFKGAPGIAHTRWATHGEPSDRNAHPHCDGANRIAVIHNGIIENAVALRAAARKRRRRLPLRDRQRGAGPPDRGDA